MNRPPAPSSWPRVEGRQNTQLTGVLRVRGRPNTHLTLHDFTRPLTSIFPVTTERGRKVVKPYQCLGDDEIPVPLRRVLRLFQRRGLLDDETVAAMLAWQAAGGFSLDASVRIHESDATGRERLLRYCARPPFALERLRSERPTAAPGASAPRDGEAGVRQVRYHPPRPTPDGRTVLALSPLEFLAALARLIPPPRVHRHRYHGVLAPNAALRARVVAMGRHDGDMPIAATAASTPPESAAGTSSHGSGAPHAPAAPQLGSPAPHLPDSPQRTAARSRWARLLARIYQVFPLRCPDCGADMRILAFITAAEPVGAILRHLGLPATLPPLSPARSPPQHGLGFDAEHSLDTDQTPTFDPTEPEPVPDFDFDRSRGDRSAAAPAEAFLPPPPSPSRPCRTRANRPTTEPTRPTQPAIAARPPAVATPVSSIVDQGPLRINLAREHEMAFGFPIPDQGLAEAWFWLGYTAPGGTAEAFYEKAAEKGYPEAFGCILDNLLFRAGDKADVVKARRFADLARALHVAVDDAESFRTIDLCSDAGEAVVPSTDRPAKTELAALAAHPDCAWILAGIGEKVDEAKYGRCVLAQDPLDNNLIAEVYANGWGVKRDATKRGDLVGISGRGGWEHLAGSAAAHRSQRGGRGAGPDGVHGGSSASGVSEHRLVQHPAWPAGPWPAGAGRTPFCRTRRCLVEARRKR